MARTKQNLQANVDAAADKLKNLDTVLVIAKQGDTSREIALSARGAALDLVGCCSAALQSLLEELPGAEIIELFLAVILADALSSLTEKHGPLEGDSSEDVSRLLCQVANHIKEDKLIEKALGIKED